MSNPASAARSEPQKAPEQRQPIPVGVLLFPKPTDLPGKPCATSVTSSKQKNTARHTIDFRPWLRAYCVTYHPIDGSKPVSRMIPESWASWTPLDE